MAGSCVDLYILPLRKNVLFHFYITTALHRCITSMAWSNPFRRTDENTRTCWGYTFQWTPDHLQPEEVERLKYSYDVLADDCLAVLDRVAPPPNAQLPRNVPRTTPSGKDGDVSSAPPKRDMYALLREFAPKDEKLGQLWQEVNTIPEWVDWEQIQRGQEVFYRYGSAALTGLAYQSLLGGMVRRLFKRFQISRS